MTTPEAIEAIPASEILVLKDLAKELHEATGGILSTPLPAKALEEQENLRNALNLKLSESISLIDQEIADREALKRELRIVKGYAASDKRRIESLKIESFIREKKERSQYPSH